MSQSNLRLAGKIALVTGGSRGLGRAMVERLAAEGARVAFSYRSDSASAADVVASVTASGGVAHALQADISSVAGVAELFAQLDATLTEATGESALDIVINNAGVIESRHIEDVSEADFDRIFDLNVKGAFFTLQKALERMRPGGRVINLGTGLTRIAMSNYAVYSAAKGAIDTLTKVLAPQLGARQITINTLAPGAIDTDMNPWLRTEQGIATMSGVTALGRVGHAADIADVAAFLASDDSRWVTAQRIEASGGQHL